MNDSSPSRAAVSSDPWPALPWAGWRDTAETLHRWTQIVGKVRLARTPWVNHSWHVALYLTPRGLTTSPIPAEAGTFQIDFDFIDHAVDVVTSRGETARVDLYPRSVADFHTDLMARLEELGVATKIHGAPNELEDATPFVEDHHHAAYDADAAGRFWRLLASSDRVLRTFRSRFIGKCSPVHFFWGSFDLAVTRFSGRTAPPHPGGIPHLPDVVAREAYSHEVSSCGFWPGNDTHPEPLFYSYAYPAPEGFDRAVVQPAQARWHTALSEFVLPAEAVRAASDPDGMLLRFLQTTYEAAADAGNWDRAALEWGPEGPPDVGPRVTGG